MMKVSEEILARIRESIDIEDVVGDVVPLKRSGAYLFGLCPFHSEKSPSFSVQPSRGRYHCFGCGADGDAIEFVRETRGLDFIEAVEALAQQAGVKLPEKQEISAQEKARLQRMSAMRTVLEEVQSHYHKALLLRIERSAQSSPSESQDPLATYCANRGLTLEVIRRFGLGWAEMGATAALLKGREAVGVSAGVLFDRDDGVRHDERAGGYGTPRWGERLRDRLTFPIADEQGRVIAFGGRIISPSMDAPKYLNTPETDLYKKSEALYHIHDARSSIHKSRRAIVVEGYMDAITLVGAGMQNVVACCGTAMTEHHLKRLLKWSDEVVMLFDGDQAGAKASAKASKMCLQHFQAGKHFRFVQIPEGTDPDELVRSKGVSSIQHLINESAELSEYLLSSTSQRHRGLRSIEDKSAFLQDIRSQIREAGLPESTFTSLLFKQAYRMAYHQSRDTPAWSPGKGTKSSGGWRDRWMATGGNGSGGTGAFHGEASTYRKAPSGLDLPIVGGLWSSLIDAINKAPTMAASVASDLSRLLDMANTEELAVYKALQIAQGQDHTRATEKSDADDRLSADFLASSSRLIIKKRRDDLIDALGVLRAKGHITEAEYLDSAMKVIDAS